jgi:hypothetical protein
MLRAPFYLVCLVGLLVPASLFAAEPAAPLSHLARMPVKEITVFKDGHAFLLHQGAMPVDAGGNVLLDYLPQPVIGTFWPYSAAKNATLTSVIAGRRKVLVEQTALSLRELLEANVGAEAIVKEVGTAPPYPATIAGFPTRNSEEIEKTRATDEAPALPVKGNVVLLRKAEGVKVVNIDRIEDVIFTSKHKSTLSNEEFRNLLTLRLDWKGAPEKTAEVGMVYLQKGVRWIPSYKVDIDGKGNAVVKLQATILNELTDLENVTCNLVVGVPTFAFQETIDPIVLGQSVAQLSQYFQRDSQTAHAFSNAMMTQHARMGEQVARVAAPLVRDLGPELPGSSKSEDLFVYTIKGLSLKKGQRVVVPVAEYALKYKDIYMLEIPIAPPTEVLRSFNNQQQTELAKLMAAPKAIHKLRLSNTSSSPLTTAPALIVRDNRVLAQGMMTYTAPGADTDLTVTTAVDIKVKKTDKETKRIPDAVNWQKTSFTRIEGGGTIALTNFRDQPVEIEVVRLVLGEIDGADHDGSVERVNLIENANVGLIPNWYGWYGWANWFQHLNGIGRATWKVKLEPGKSIDLGYQWHYYWQ